MSYVKHTKIGKNMLYEVELLKYKNFKYYNYYFNSKDDALTKYNKLIKKYQNKQVKVSLNEIDVENKTINNLERWQYNENS